MSSEVVFRESVIPTSLVLTVTGLATIVAKLAFAERHSWQISLLVAAVGLLLPFVHPAGPARVVVGTASIRVRDGDEESESSLLELVAVEWANEDSIGFRRLGGELFVVSRGRIPEGRWKALEGLLRERLQLGWTCEENPFVRSMI
ncbi:MAG: hypothetical protein R2991_03475 [Thermoanaerobaculia bacterium]